MFILNKNLFLYFKFLFSRGFSLQPFFLDLEIKFFNNKFLTLINSLFVLNRLYIYCFLNELILFKFFYSFQKRFFIKFILFFCNFYYYKIFIKIGLGFRKKFSYKRRCFLMHVGLRYWIIFKPMPTTFFFNAKRRSLFLFSITKNELYLNITRLKYLRNETVFKVKGIMMYNRIKMNRRISRAIIFARRIKFKRAKLKMTKKQKQRR